MKKQSRYPGLRAFREKESMLFFGREQESRDLFQQMQLQRLVVLYSKSGTGKSSLLNAGLIPLLEDHIYYPIKVRLQNTLITPVEAVKNAVIPNYQDSPTTDSNIQIDIDKLSVFENQRLEEISLWSFLKACKFKKEDKQLIPILLFDQFEEFFNHDRDKQLELADELANLVGFRLPLAVRADFRAIKRSERTPAITDWFQPINVRVVISIRSDHLYQLDKIEHIIPNIFNVRFPLRPLNREAARKAIVEPAKSTESNFFTDPFAYEEVAIKEILESLADKDGDIEPFELQLICQKIEQKVAWEQKD